MSVRPTRWLNLFGNVAHTYCDQDRKGYALLTLTSKTATAEFVTVSTVLTKPFAREIGARFAIGSYRRLPLQPETSAE